MKIGIIGGTGWLGRLISKCLLKSGVVSAGELILSNRSGSFASSPELKNHARITTDNQALADDSDMIILSVLPHQFPQLNINAADKLVISVMSGVSVARLQQAVQSRKIVRAMPNIAIEIQESFTPWFCEVDLTALETEQMITLLNSFGISERVYSEQAIDFLTALTGSGQGSLAFFEMAFIQSAVQHGIDEATALKAVKQLFFGISAFLRSHHQHPQEDVKKLIDYAGTTAAILLEMQRSGLAEKIATAIDKGYLKASKGMTQES